MQQQRMTDISSHNTRKCKDSSSRNNDDCPDTVEALLSVPLPIVVWQVPGTQKPLLTRGEAKVFLQITMLAHEIDTLASVSSSALNRRLWSRQFADKLRTSHPFLRPLLPLLTIQGTMVPTSALYGIEQELNRIVIELEHCGASLKQFSEQNWTLSEMLSEGEEESQHYTGNDSAITMDKNGQQKLTKGAILAQEKRKLSDLQEEVSNRIEGLLAQCDDEDGKLHHPWSSQGGENNETEGKNSQESSQGGRRNETDYSDLSLSDVCSKLWNMANRSREKNENNVNSNNTTASIDRVADDTLQDQENNSIQYENTHSRKNRHLTAEDGQEGLFSYPETIQGLDQKMIMEDTNAQTDMAIDALQALQKQQQQQEQASAGWGSPKYDSQQSTHSIVSNHSTPDNHDSTSIPTYVDATAMMRPTRSEESQIKRQNASEALAALAGF